MTSHCSIAKNGPTMMDKFKTICKICRIVIEEKDNKYAFSFISRTEGANGDIWLRYKDGTSKKTNVLETIVESDTFEEGINQTWDFFTNLDAIWFGYDDGYDIFSWNGSEFIERPLI